MDLTVAAVAAIAFNATIVGVVEVAPGVCQVDLLNPPELHEKLPPINTIKVDCEYVAQVPINTPSTGETK